MTKSILVELLPNAPIEQNVEKINKALEPFHLKFESTEAGENGAYQVRLVSTLTPEIIQKILSNPKVELHDGDSEPQ